MDHRPPIPISKDFKVIIRPNTSILKLDPSIENHVEAIWNYEIDRTQGKIFNGKLLSAWGGFNEKELIGDFVEYKHYLAQARDPSLINILKIHPICVCGYTVSGDHILIGKRSKAVTDYPNYYELVPAGGIDIKSVENNQVDIYKQIKIELKEEAGLDESQVLSAVPKYLITCADTNSYEICFNIELSPLLKNQNLLGNGEYTRLLWIKKSQLETFIKEHQNEIIPLSLQIVDLFKSNLHP